MSRQLRRWPLGGMIARAFWAFHKISLVISSWFAAPALHSQYLTFVASVLTPDQRPTMSMRVLCCWLPVCHQSALLLAWLFTLPIRLTLFVSCVKQKWRDADPVVHKSIGGAGSTFPSATSSCDVQHCASTFVPWYEANFEQCQSDLRGFGGDDSDIAALSVFVNTCRAVDTQDPERNPQCEPLFLGPAVGFHNVRPL